MLLQVQVLSFHLYFGHGQPEDDPEQQRKTCSYVAYLHVFKTDSHWCIQVLIVVGLTTDDLFLQRCEFSGGTIHLWAYCFASIAVHDETAVVLHPGDGCISAAGKVIPVCVFRADFKIFSC